ncbi:MAG: type II secretion system protein [Vulcanimicrobiota bacterium]
MLKRGKRGFTLIEVIVVLVIFGTVIAMLIPYYRNYRDTRAVEYWKDMMVSDLNRCKTMAINEEKLWGIRITGESSYEYVFSTDDGAVWSEPEKRIKRNLTDSASRISFTDISPGSVISFSPAASVGDSSGSQWANITAKRDSSPAPFTFKIKCGTHQRAINVSRSSYCSGCE